MDSQDPRFLACLALTFGALLLATACAGDPSTSRPTPSRDQRVEVSVEPPRPGLRAEFVQLRSQEGTDLGAIRVENYTGRALDVRAVRLVWDGFPQQPQATKYVVPPSSTIDLRITLPRPRCAASSPPRDAVSEVTTSDGRVLRRPMAGAGVRYLTRVHRSVCSRQLLQSAVSISYAGPWTERVQSGRTVLRGSLRLTRRDSTTSHPVTVEAVEGSVLFDLALGSPDRLPASTTQIDIPLVVDAGRCDQHARSQSSQSFTFRLRARVGSAPDLLSIVQIPPPDVQQTLLSYLDRRCAPGG